MTPTQDPWLPDANESFPEIARRLRRGRPAVFLDYDGTLAPIAPRPDLARLPPGTHALLRRLVRLCSVAVISGRGLPDLKMHVDVPGLLFAGSHGFEIEGPAGRPREWPDAERFVPLLDRVERDVHAAVGRLGGVIVERKRFGIGVHTRLADPTTAREAEAAVAQILRANPTLRQRVGKRLVELQPDLDWDKGKAVGFLLDALGAPAGSWVPVFIGDDVTDEDAFRAVGPHGIPIIVAEEPRQTFATYRLAAPTDVARFLERLCDHLSPPRGVPAP